MSKTIIYTVSVEFGDCDPAAIVWFPNFYRWIDAASRHFFVQCGVPRWEETASTLGIIGTPLVDSKASFARTASYGDRLHIAVSVSEWRNKSFVQTYRITRDRTDGGEPDLIMTCEEVRIFAARRPVTEGGGIRAVPAPDLIKELCT
jgi:4-hydroxybenzoyl-CoA thioesterase